MRFLFFRCYSSQPKVKRSRFFAPPSLTRLFSCATFSTGMALFLCLIGTFSGCSQNRNAVLELERENRTLEDALYQMKYQTTMATRNAARAQKESDRLRNQLAIANEKANNASSYYQNNSNNSERVENTPHSTYFQSAPPQTTPVAPQMTSQKSVQVSPTLQPEIIPTPTPIATQSRNENRILPTSATISVPTPVPSMGGHGVGDGNGSVAGAMSSGNPMDKITIASPIAAGASISINGQNAVSQNSVSMADNGQSTTVYPATVDQNNPYGIVAIPSVQDSADVTEIVLNPTLTGGWDIDGMAGDEGIRVLIEPRDRYGRTVRTTGAIQISLVDPQIASAQGYCGTWNFDAKQAAPSFVYSTTGEGMYFELPLTQSIYHSNLTLFVRFIDRNGRRLESHGPLTLRPRSEAVVTTSPQAITAPTTAAANQSPFYVNTLTSSAGTDTAPGSDRVWQQSNRSVTTTMQPVARQPMLETLPSANLVSTANSTNKTNRPASTATPVSYTTSASAKPNIGAISRRPITLTPQPSVNSTNASNSTNTSATLISPPNATAPDSGTATTGTMAIGTAVSTGSWSPNR